MKIIMRLQARSVWLAVLLAALISINSAAYATHQQVVQGLIVNIGVVAAGQAARFPEESASHPNLGRTNDDHHLVVSLSDAQSGAHVANATVSADVRGPNGRVQAKELVRNVTHGMPDYSEVFDMHVPGLYRITVYVTTAADARPFSAKFEWTNPG